MKKSIRRLLSVSLALVMTVGLFPGMATVHAAEVSANGIEEQNDAVNETAVGTEEQNNAVNKTAVGTEASNNTVNETVEGTPEPEPNGATDSDKIDAFFDARDNYNAAADALWEKNNNYWDWLNSGAWVDTPDAVLQKSEAEYNEYYQAWKTLYNEHKSLKQAAINAYGELETAFNDLSDEEKRDSSRDVTPQSVWDEINEYYSDIEDYVFEEAPPSSPSWFKYWRKLLDGEDSVVSLISKTEAAMKAFDEANKAYQKELAKENPDPATLDSLYKAATEKYNELIAAENALEKSYKELEAIYQKIPAELQAWEQPDGSRLSNDWNTLTSEITLQRTNVEKKVNPALSGATPANNSNQTAQAAAQASGTPLKAPKTGDDTPLAGLFAVMFSSLALGIGSIGFYVWRRKKKFAE